jgi:outer membrane protein OmpA-like peptidoglycan-associated protein
LHTDSRGGHEFNKSLSNKRSKSFVSYSNQKGIETSRLIAVGYGESKLLNDCKDGVSCLETKHPKKQDNII